MCDLKTDCICRNKAAMISVIILLLLSNVLYSCSKEETLAMGLDGCWTAQTVEVTASKHYSDSNLGLAGGVTLSCTPKFTFIKDEDVDGGKLALEANFVFHANDAVKTAIPAAVIAGGTWSTLSDDEIIVSFNPRDINVTMDPAVQSISYSTIVGQPREALDSATVNELSHQQALAGIVENIVKSVNKIKRIRIDNQEMSAEINGIDLEFKR